MSLSILCLKGVGCNMGYSLDPVSNGCYEGTSVLVNKFNIKDGSKLDTVEQGITGALIAKASIMLQKHILKHSCISQNPVKE